MKVLITGANGMVARAALEYCRAIGDDVTALTRQDLDIANAESVNAAIDQHRPGTILNCAGYTDVDGAEGDPEGCRAVNAKGVENLALACGKYNAAFVTVSTDYVFDGDKEGFYDQRDTPNPQGVYARSKLEGEARARNANARSIIVRSGWIYGSGGTNFLSVMPGLLAAGKPIMAIADSFGTPTFAGDLAARLRELAELDLPCTFHVTNAGSGTSYLGFAQKLCEIGGFDKKLVEPVSQNLIDRPAARPINSKLACLFSKRFGLLPLPDWTSALASFLSEQ